MDRTRDVYGDNLTSPAFDFDIAENKADILKLDDDFDVGATEVSLDIDARAEVDADEQDEDVELSPGGILDEETITRGLSNLGRSANGCHQVYLNVTIPGFSLTDISLLSEYVHLQKVEIPYNDLTDLSPLGKLKYLLFLDASHNKIEDLLKFEPPVSLLEVNMSWNNIHVMCDLSAHGCLRKLILDNNNIRIINGLQKCKKLRYLSLSHNHIVEIDGLGDLPIQYLNLRNNKLKILQGLQSLKDLKEIHLSGNCIRSLSGLKMNTKLESVDLEANEVLDIMEMYNLKNAKNLYELNLLRNPIQEIPDYRLSVLLEINRLTILDRHPVKEHEKVSAVNMFDPPKEVVAARDHIMHVVYSFLQPSRVKDSTLPSIKTPYPMLVLVGPQGSNKGNLCRKLVEEFGDYFGYGVSHTTRSPRLDEIAGKDYNFVSLIDFETDIKMGAFIQTCLYNNYWYGLQLESIESIAREGLACVVHMELEGVLTLKQTYFEPRYVLMIPLNSEAHEKNLQSKGTYTEEQINVILARSDMYIQHNQNHPGFFDMMINSDDFNEAYAQLRKLVMDYLGISKTSIISNTHPESITDHHEISESIPALPGRALSNLMRSSTWSRPSISENLSQHQSSRIESVTRGILEVESHKRRQSAAKQLVAGNKPTLIEQLQKKYPSAAPQIVDHQISLEEKGQRSHSAPANQSRPQTVNGETELPNSPDSSSVECADSCLLDPDLSPEMDRDNEDDKNEYLNDLLLPEKNISSDAYSYFSMSGTRFYDLPSPDFRRNSKYANVKRVSNMRAILPPIKKGAL